MTALDVDGMRGAEGTVRQKPTLPPETRTAYHEAGHAVVRFFSPRTAKVKHATIIPDPKAGTVGHCEHWKSTSFRPDVERDDRTRLRIEEEITILLAGTIAERRVAGRYDHVGARSDRERAADLAGYVCQDEREVGAFLRWLWLRAEALVAGRWPQIEAVASALLAEKTLDGKRLQEVIFRS